MLKAWTRDQLLELTNTKLASVYNAMIREGGASTKSFEQISRFAKKEAAVTKVLELQQVILGGVQQTVTTDIVQMDTDLLMTIEQIAVIFGVTSTTARKWQVPVRSYRQGARRGVKVNLYYLPEVVKDRIDSVKNQRSGGLEAERERKTHHDANIAELTERKMRGELFDANEIIHVCTAAHSAAKQRIRSIHSAVANRFPELDIDVIEEIESIANRAMNDIGQGGIPDQIRKRLADPNDEPPFKASDESSTDGSEKKPARRAKRQSKKKAPATRRAKKQQSD